ncbi:MAG: MFS transporter [Sulfuricaulis sp.]|uniref:MFS transporter n=1 Tax=Sulfuricaulis sp. TaxID=2003553 RepID=UPI0025E2E8DC|nr:MFS transporter [Sulfuricaulis sp.]MCR4347681.1 MFS transporter [Sulfuricaulis sp.]
MKRSHSNTGANPDVRVRMRRLRWTTFSLVAASYMLAFFHRMAPAAIASDLQLAFDASATALGALAATYFYVYTLMQIPTGILADTLGPRRIVTLGGAIAGVGSLLFGYAVTMTEASIGRMLIGLGVSVAFIALLKINAAWFHDRHFGTMVGLTLVLGNIGSVMAAAPLAWVLQFTTWNTVFIVLGGVSFALAVLTWLFVRDHPGEAGLPSLREMDGHEAHPPHEGHWFEGLMTVLRNRYTWPIFWMNLGIGGSFIAFAGLWAVPYLSDVYGMERVAATQHTSLMLAGFAIGAFSVGVLSDRLGRRRPALISTAFVHLLCWLPLVFALPMSLAMSYSLFLLMGLSAGSFTLSWACVKEVNPHALSGMATSVVNTGVFLGTGILQPLVGWTLDRAGTAQGAAAQYRLGILIFFFCVVVGFVGSLRVRETYCRYIS